MPHKVFAQLLCSYPTTSLLSSSPSPNVPGSILGLTGLMLDMLDALPWSRNGEFRSPDVEILASPVEFLRSPATAEALISTSSRFCMRVRTRDDDAVARRPCAKRGRWGGGRGNNSKQGRGMPCVALTNSLLVLRRAEKELGTDGAPGGCFPPPDLSGIVRGLALGPDREFTVEFNFRFRSVCTCGVSRVLVKGMFSYCAFLQIRKKLQTTHIDREGLVCSQIAGAFLLYCSRLKIVGAKIPRISETKIARAKGFVRSA